jgi:hypothetical protein
VGCTFTGAESTPAETGAAESPSVSTVETREMTTGEQEVAALSGMSTTFLEYDLAEEVKYLSLYVDVWTPEGLAMSRLMMYGEVGDGAGDFPDSGSFGIASDLHSGDDGYESVIWRIQTGNAIAAFETELPQQASGAYSGYSSYGSVGAQEPCEMRTDKGAIVFYLRFDIGGPTEGGRALYTGPAEDLNENRDRLTDTDSVTVVLRSSRPPRRPKRKLPRPRRIRGGTTGRRRRGGGRDLRYFQFRRQHGHTPHRRGGREL